LAAIGGGILAAIISSSSRRATPWSATQPAALLRIPMMSDSDSD